MASQAEITLANLASGALMECATVELRKICENIQDPNVKKDAKRKLTVNIVMKPDKAGQMVAIDYEVKSTMPGPDGGKTVAYLAMAKDSRALGLFELSQPPLFDEQGGEQTTIPFDPAKRA